MIFAEAPGAPQVNTVRYDAGWVSAPVQDYQSQIMRMKVPVAPIPTWSPAYQFSVPPFAYKLRGNWTAPDVPTAAFAQNESVRDIIPPSPYPWPTEAPEIPYRNKSWSPLIARAAFPIKVPVQPAYQLTAPPVTVNISS